MSRLTYDTVEHALSKNGGFGPGFDFLRVLLALLIVLFHSAVVTGALEEAVGGPRRGASSIFPCGPFRMKYSVMVLCLE
jgi:peptidoglycan/LPS O-acetylase OafA/YrhL